MIICKSGVVLIICLLLKMRSIPLQRNVQKFLSLKNLAQTIVFFVFVSNFFSNFYIHKLFITLLVQSSAMIFIVTNTHLHLFI